MIKIENKSLGSYLKLAANTLGTIFWIMLMGVSLVLLWPSSWGGKVTIVMVSGDSMKPTYYNGGIVVAIKKDTYSTGDVIVYHPASLPCDACNVVHRVVSGDGIEGYTTLGDNNEVPDVWKPKDEEVVGKVESYFNIGKVSLLLSNKIMWLTLILVSISILAGIYAYENAKKIWVDPDEDEETEDNENESKNSDDDLYGPDDYSLMR